MALENVVMDQRAIGSEPRILPHDLKQELIVSGTLHHFTKAVALYQQATHARAQAEHMTEAYYVALTAAVNAGVPQNYLAQGLGVTAAAVSTALKRHRKRSE